MFDKKDFGTFIKKQRLRQGYSIPQICKMLGITKSAYIRKENGTNPFTLIEATILSVYLKYHMATIETFYFGNTTEAGSPGNLPQANSS